MQDYTHYHILGHTVDDTASEAFDKVARTLGLLSRRPQRGQCTAKTGNPRPIACRCPMWTASTT